MCLEKSISISNVFHCKSHIDRCERDKFCITQEGSKVPRDVSTAIGTVSPRLETLLSIDQIAWRHTAEVGHSHVHGCRKVNGR